MNTTPSVIRPRSLQKAFNVVLAAYVLSVIPSAIEYGRCMAAGIETDCEAEASSAGSGFINLAVVVSARLLPTSEDQEESHMIRQIAHKAMGPLGNYNPVVDADDV